MVDSVGVLGPVQRLSLNDPVMFDHYVDDLVGLHLLAREAERQLVPRDPVLGHRLKLARDRVLAAAWIDAELERRQPITEESLHAFFAKNREHFQGAPRIRFRQILTRTRGAAEEALAELGRGDDFADVARRLSVHPSAERGGEMGWHESDRIEPELQAAVNDLAPGDRTPVVTTRFGFHVAEVEERRAPKPVSFEAVRSRVEQELRWQRRRDVSQELLEEARHGAGVVVDKAMVEELFRQLRARPREAGAADDAGTPE